MYGKPQTPTSARSRYDNERCPLTSARGETATVAALRHHGGELIGEVAQYESTYLLCYVRGPEQIIVALAQQL